MDLRLIETIILTIINASGLFLIIVVLANSAREKIYRWFAVLTFCLLGWVDFAYLGYFQDSSLLATIFYRINLAFVSLFIFAGYMFYIESFLKIEKPKVKLTLFGVSMLFVFLSLFTSTINNGVIPREWGNEVVFGSLNMLFNLFVVSMTIVFIYFLISRYISLGIEERKKVVYFLIGTFSIIVLNLIFNVMYPFFWESARFQHLGDYSAILFLSFTAFAMLRHKFLNVKVATAAFFISAMWVLVIIDILLLSNSIAEQGVKLVILLIFIGLSILLVRSILNEIRQRELLAELSRQQKDIIDVFGHELKTPFTSIKQEATYLLEVFTGKIKQNLLEGIITKRDAEELLEGLETINIASDQGIQETATMLETARLDKARFSLEYSRFDLVELVQKAYRVVEKQLDPETYDVRFDIEQDEVQVEADAVRIREAVTALLTNAKKYGVNPETKKSKIEISINTDDDFVYVTVKDNGFGIKRSDIQELGKKFKRLDEQTKGGLKRPGGTGLGLFVVKGIMNRHSGELIIESEGLGKGSAFTLKFPINKPE